MAMAATAQTYVALAVAACAVTAARAQQPQVLVHNASLIAYTKRRLAAGDPSLSLAYAAVLAAADAALSMGPYSVLDAKTTPPSGDKHDYMSTARYGWPCNVAWDICRTLTPGGCNMTSGLPWILCDGHANAAADADSDGERLFNMSTSVIALARGYLFSGKLSYATRAAELLRVWFVDRATAMNPNLKYAQVLPPSVGMWYGIIDLSTNFAELMDAVAFIAPSGAWRPSDQVALRAWCRELVVWLRTSPQGQKEGTWINNHQTWMDTVLVSCLLMDGDDAGARAVIVSATEPPPVGNEFAPVGGQIYANGELPAELNRTNSVGYFMYDCSALLQLGQQSRHVPAAPDLLAYVSVANASSIRGAVGFALPYILGQREWRWPNILNETWSQAGAFEVLRRAAHAGWADPQMYGDAAAHVASGGDDLATATQLFWPWPLVAE